MRFPTFKHIYYYVPPCPRCGSRKTGRYIRAPFTGSGFTKEESLKNGELVRFAIEEPINNGFCVSCGHEWPVRVETKLWTYDQIHEEQIARGTELLYEQYINQKAGARQKKEKNFTKYNHNTEEHIETAHAVKLEPEIIDARKRDRIELIYADEDLLEKVRNVQRTGM